MYYLFHDKVWMCFEGELPVKPDYVNPDRTTTYDRAMLLYNQAIATLKSKALPVQNYGEIYTVANDNLDREIKLPCIEVEGIGEVFEWSGSVEKKQIELCSADHEHTRSCWDEVYILHLPKPDMSNNEPLPEMYYITGPDEFVKGEQIERIPLVNTDKAWDANYEEALNIYLSEDINYGANTIKNADVDDLKQLASDSFYKGYNVAMEENTRLRKLIEKAFHEGYILEGSLNDYYEKTWEQFKKDNDL